MSLTVDVKIAANGRMVLPQAMRKALGVHGETRLIAKFDNGTVRLTPVSVAAEEARQIYRDNAVRISSTDDFLKDRKLEERNARKRGR